MTNEWPKKDAWLRKYLEERDFLWKIYDKKIATEKDFFNLEYWETVSACCNGLDVAFLNSQFDRMHRWFLDYPQRRPTIKFLRRYVGDWLQRGAEKERKFVRASFAAQTYRRQFKDR